MSNKDKIALLEAQLKSATAMLDHMGAMILPCTQALRYIATGPEEEKSKIILLKQVGIPAPAAQDKQPDKEVAVECLMLLQQIQNDFKEANPLPEKKSHLSLVDTPEEVRLGDGGEIIFSTHFDILYHECCGCGLKHEVQLEWKMNSPDGSFAPVLTTKWTQIKALPTEAEVNEAGNTVVKL